VRVVRERLEKIIYCAERKMRIYIDTTTYGPMADVNLSPPHYPFIMADIIKGK
jgi:hypothetical protein